MITFETQKEFEDAVMDIINYRLGLNVFSRGTCVTVQLYDSNKVSGFSDGVMHERSSE